MKSLEELPIEVIDIKDIKGIHPIADRNPNMPTDDYYRLTEAIKLIGITEAIILYRGKVVDGRHRYKIAKEIGLKSIPVRIIPYKTKLDTFMEKLIMAKEVRRHTTPTQKACKGALIYFELIGSDGKKNQTVVAKDTQVSLRLLKYAIYLYKYNRDYFDELYKGNAIKIKNNFTTRLEVIVQHVKEKQKEGITKDNQIIEVSETYLEDEFVINGRKKFYENVLKESNNLKLTVKDLADYFYALHKEQTMAECNHFFKFNPETQDTQCVKCGIFKTDYKKQKTK